MIPLTNDERAGIVVAVQSVFRKLANLSDAVAPIYLAYGFAAPSAGVLARERSEKLETAIIQHCPTFARGRQSFDLRRAGEDWEVKVCGRAGLTINQSYRVSGEHYIVVNYSGFHVTRIFVLAAASDAWFTPRRANSNARSLRWTEAVGAGRIEILRGDE